MAGPLLLLLVFILRFRIISTQTCNCDVAKQNDIGIEDGHIPDSSFTASSSLDVFHGPSRARLNQAAHARQGSAWCAKIQDSNQYLQIDLVYSSKITHIATQGRFDPPQNVNGSNATNWVKYYNIQYSIDGEQYIWYDVHGKAKVFDGNKGGDSIKCCELPYPLVVQHFRFHPISWHEKICMRIGIFGEWNVTVYSDATNGHILVGNYWWWLIFWVVIIFVFMIFVIVVLVYCCCLRKRVYAAERPKSTKRTSFTKNPSGAMYQEDPHLRTSSVNIYNSTTKIAEGTPYATDPMEDSEIQEVVAEFEDDGHKEVAQQHHRIVSFSIKSEDEHTSPSSRINAGYDNAHDGRVNRNGSPVYDNFPGGVI